MRIIHNHTHNFFVDTNFSGTGKKIEKREDRRDPCTKNLPLFTFDEQLKFNCKSFWSIHRRLEMPQPKVVPLSVLSEAFLSIYISLLIFLDKKIQRFSCCGQNPCFQWCTTLSCLMKQQFGGNEAQLEIEDLEWKYLG